MIWKSCCRSPTGIFSLAAKAEKTTRRRPITTNVRFIYPTDTTERLFCIAKCESEETKKPENDSPAFLKNWRLPTLAEPIGLLPSARLCLTAEFGMGSGRTTALWPPKNVAVRPVRRVAKSNHSLKTAHRRFKAPY